MLSYFSRLILTVYEIINYFKKTERVVEITHSKPILENNRLTSAGEQQQCTAKIRCYRNSTMLRYIVAALCFRHHIKELALTEIGEHLDSRQAIASLRENGVAQWGLAGRMT